ncbi:MAG: sigma-54-dependent Fis family transcriptional regulator [Spirochaetes bacterium]|nr:sigma-54-dependent Fis family transcriptional regulator [Spirochaetota bacterium]
MKIFLIDDEESIRVGIGEDIRDLGHEVLDFEDPLAALDALPREEPDLVFCDLRMPNQGGAETLRRIRKHDPGIIVIIITAFGDVQSSIECIKAGAFDYLCKPFQVEDLRGVLEKAAVFASYRLAARELARERTARFGRLTFIGKTPAMARVFEQVETAAGSDATVLVEGETGTGKEVVADAIHQQSARKNGPMVKFSCSTFSSTVIESELFGHELGAFTGAVRQKRGRFELAEGGTLFLDEVDDIPMDLQVKLLRFIQNRTFERVGGEKSLKANVRLIAATKKDLLALVERGLFRSDLYYRLNVLPIDLPPLRERREDIPLLVHHFLGKYGASRDLRLSPEAFACLMAAPWPGNVRQLENLIERLSVTAAGPEIAASDLPDELKCPAPSAKAESAEGPIGPGFSLEQWLSEAEKKHLTQALKQASGNQKEAAALLGIPSSTFRNKALRLKLLSSEGLEGDPADRK